MNPAIAWALFVHVGKTESVAQQRAWARATAARDGWTLTEMFSAPRSDVQPRSTISRIISKFDAIAADQRPARLLIMRLELLGPGDAMKAIGVCLRLHKLGMLVHTQLDRDVTPDNVAHVVTPLARLLVFCMQPDIPQKERGAAKRRRRKKQ